MEGEHRIELVRRRPAAALDGLVAGMVGLSERAGGVVRRRQPAGALVPVVISFGEPLTIEALTGATGAGRHGSFVAGLSTGAATTRFEGGQDCVQVYLTPVGVRAVLGVPGREVARRVLRAADVLPALGDGLADRLGTAPTWQERFDLVEEVLLRQVAGAPGTPPWVPWLWDRIHRRGGQVRIRDLVAETGWSHRHVTTVFAEQAGLTPKQVAGLVRFERASADLGRLSLAEVAARHGYADQSHLSRDVARYAGETPAALAAAQRPTPATAMGLQ